MINITTEEMMHPIVVFVPTNTTGIDLHVSTSDGKTHNFELCKQDIFNAKATADRLCEKAFLDLSVNKHYYEYNEDNCKKCPYNHDEEDNPNNNKEDEIPIQKAYTTNNYRITIAEPKEDIYFADTMNKYLDKQDEKEIDIDEDDESLDEILNYYMTDLKAISDDFNYTLQCFYDEINELIKPSKKRIKTSHIKSFEG